MDDSAVEGPSPVLERSRNEAGRFQHQLDPQKNPQFKLLTKGLHGEVKFLNSAFFLYNFLSSLSSTE